MAATKRFRDVIRSFLPWWLTDRPGKNVGFRVVWMLVSVLDAAVEVAFLGIQASWPGVGTPTALPLLGRSRGILRGQGETDGAFSARLLLWLDRWRIAGSAEALARTLHEFLGDHPRVRVITRSGIWVTVDAAGVLSRTAAAWDWDSVSNPERSGWWSDLWVVVYPVQWALSPLTIGGGRVIGADSLGLGHKVTRGEWDAVRGLLSTWKSAHTRVRTVIWTSSAARFDPTNPATCPNGKWGQWSFVDGGGHSIAGDRDVTECRYWEMPCG